MKNLLYPLALLPAIAVADVPNTFQSGQIATAKAFNENFQSIDSEIESIKKDLTTIKAEGVIDNRYVLAKVNGVEMQVANFTIGYYTIITPTGVTVNVNANGELFGGGRSFYYESNDCMGQPYSPSLIIDHSGLEKGSVLLNPTFTTNVTILTDENNNIFYTPSDEIFILHYNSYKSSGSDCREIQGSSVVGKILPNNPEITGIISFPLIITGAGSPLVISDVIGQ